MIGWVALDMTVGRIGLVIAKTPDPFPYFYLDFNKEHGEADIKMVKDKDIVCLTPPEDGKQEKEAL